MDDRLEGVLPTEKLKGPTGSNISSGGWLRGESTVDKFDTLESRLKDILLKILLGLTLAVLRICELEIWPIGF